MKPTHIADRKAREELSRLLERFARRRRPIRVVKKSEYWHQRAAGAALWAVTFGGQNKYLTHYVTTLGHTIYVPDDFDGWEPTRALEILRHEAVHVAQFERYGWVVMVLFYGVLPLPMGLAWFRARFEWEAYEETLRAVAEIEGLAAARAPALRAEIVRRFTGPDYGWMWPFPRTVERWIDEALVRIEGELARKAPSTPSADTL
ncbi:hypothetical protein [Polyangium sorediatum]|uniref:DUF4157 domain-containing protein n=1 Tax=Polyangium sorediatum TaxID=889274 RepID=A0ABT6NLU4_9BACT|nr:hypothetical protein [Polyangium sorediatum]MDI1429296.1 hypothetical protein [Polyangium sorediatum]